MKTANQNNSSAVENNRKFWNRNAGTYQEHTFISTADFHFGPMVPGDSQLKLLPQITPGMRCLEIGCGAAQNSIYLAKLGAECVASDISKAQLEHAGKLCREHDVNVEFICCPMEDISVESFGKFDLVHSSYALSFSGSPEKVVGNLAEMLNPGGTMILADGHPLFAGEWLELDEERGIFLKNYFSPEPDIRYDDEDNETVRCVLTPIGIMADWIIGSGLTIAKISEPAGIDISEMEFDDIREKVPYFSEAWLEYAEQFLHTPAVVIFKVGKPQGLSLD